MEIYVRNDIFVTVNEDWLPEVTIILGEDRVVLTLMDVDGLIKILTRLADLDELVAALTKVANLYNDEGVKEILWKLT